MNSSHSSRHFGRRTRCVVISTLAGLLVVCLGCSKSPATAKKPKHSQFGGSEFVSSEPISPIFADDSLDPDQVALGKVLFHDRRLSKGNSISCADCHKISEGGDDGRIKAVGYRKRVGTVNTPTVLNSSFFIAQFWDGRVETLEEQVPGPIHSPVEMATDWDEVIGKLNDDSNLKKKFQKAYDAPISKDLIVKAIVTYEKALVTENAPFDRYLMGHQDAITESAKEGYRLFKKIGCISCHQGRAVGGNMFQTFGIMDDYFAERSVGNADKGRFNVTKRSSDLHRFKVPSLRNAIVTAPYFHDGSAVTLEDAVAKMAKFQLGTPVNDEEISHIVEFIKSLHGSVAEVLQ